jgi:predicted transcriptional regulator
MSTEDRTLRIRVADAEQAHEETREAIEALERGEEVENRHILTLTNEADLARLVSETNLELLRAINEHEPESMRQVAELVDRDYRDVHRNLTELEALNVVEFVDEGRSRRPVVRYDDIEIDIDVSPGSGKRGATLA